MSDREIAVKTARKVIGVSMEHQVIDLILHAIKKAKKVKP